MRNITINQQQFEVLQGFMTHCWCVFHTSEKEQFELWNNLMDELKIPFYAQNMASYLMRKKGNGTQYFSYLLEQEGIKIK
jgi:hypothetical protein